MQITKDSGVWSVETRPGDAPALAAWLREAEGPSCGAPFYIDGVYFSGVESERAALADGVEIGARVTPSAAPVGGTNAESNRPVTLGPFPKLAGVLRMLVAARARRKSDVAAAAGVGLTHLGQVLSGEAAPSTGLVVRIARAVGVEEQLVFEAARAEPTSEAAAAFFWALIR